MKADHVEDGDHLLPKPTFQQMKFPNKKYKIILCDPPYNYNDKALAGNRGASCKYPTMTLEEMRNLPVNAIAEKDSILFIWGTWTHNQEVHQLIQAWGFKYKTVGFVWVKKTKENKYFLGMGHYTRSNSEYCLIATRGKGCKRINRGISQIIDAQRKHHSQKPAIVREKILELYGDLPRIELFARENTSGWDAWRNDPNLNPKSSDEVEIVAGVAN